MGPRPAEVLLMTIQLRRKNNDTSYACISGIMMDNGLVAPSVAKSRRYK